MNTDLFWAIAGFVLQVAIGATMLYVFIHFAVKYW